MTQAESLWLGFELTVLPGLDVFDKVAVRMPLGVEILFGIGNDLRPGHFWESDGGKMVTIPTAEQRPPVERPAPLASSEAIHLATSARRNRALPL